MSAQPPEPVTAEESRQEDYISTSRDYTRMLWNAVQGLKGMQMEWNANVYGDNLKDGAGANEGITKDQVGAVIFDTTDAVLNLLQTAGHAGNLGKLL